MGRLLSSGYLGGFYPKAHPSPYLEQQLAGDCIYSDHSGNILISGTTLDTLDFISPNALYGSISNFYHHGPYFAFFLLKLTPLCDSIITATYLYAPTGNNDTHKTAAQPILAVDSKNNILLVRSEIDTSIFTPVHAYKNNLESIDIGLIKLDSMLSKIQYATFIGGEYVDNVSDMMLDDEDNVYLTGSTSSQQFPMINSTQVCVKNGRNPNLFDGYVMKISPDGYPLFSTCLGGSDVDYGIRLGMNRCGELVVYGKTQSSDYPFINPKDSIHYGNTTKNILTVIDTLTHSISYSSLFPLPGDTSGAGGPAVRVSLGNYVLHTGSVSNSFPASIPTMQFNHQSRELPISTFSVSISQPVK